MQSNNNNSLRNKENIIKATLGICLPLAYYYVCFFGYYSILFFIPATIVVSVLYSVPYFLNAHKIKSNNVTTIKAFIVNDALFSLLPASSCCVLTAIILETFFTGYEDVWLFAVILLLIFIIVALYFWLRYFVSNSVIKRLKEKKDSRP